MTDRTLLNQYVRTRDQQAFAEIMRRHLDMVYAAALRQCADPGAAEEVTQRVFVLLITKARTVEARDSLAGWLLAVTRFCVLDVHRSESRRRRHENAAANERREAQVNESTEELQPMLDDVVSELKPADRDVVALRFFQNRPIEEVAAALGTTTGAAQRRISRAVERLRTAFKKRGIVTACESLTAVLMAQSLSVAPAGIVTKVAAVCSATKPIAAGGVMTLGIIKPLAIAAAAVAIIATAAVVILPPSTTTPEVVAQANPSATSPVDFRTAYALEEGQILKRISPPIFPERDEFLRKIDAEMFSRPQACAYFQWNGALQLRGTMTDTPDVGDLLWTLAKISPQQTDLSRDIIAQPAAGDWVIRASASREMVAAELATHMPELFGAGLKFELIPIEREAIVATGRCALPDDLQSRDVHLAPNDGRGDRPAGYSMAQSPQEMLDKLGEMAGLPVVYDQVEFGSSRGVSIARYRNFDFRRTPNAPDAATVKQLLDSVSAQTGLAFRIERRMVPTWQLVPKDQ